MNSGLKTIVHLIFPVVLIGALTAEAAEHRLPLPHRPPVPDPATITVDTSQIYKIDGQYFVKATNIPSWLTPTVLPGGALGVPLPGPDGTIKLPYPKSSAVASRLTMLATMRSFVSLTMQLRRAAAEASNHDQQINAMMKKHHVDPDALPKDAKPMLDEEEADSNRFVKIGDNVIEMGPWHTFFSGYGLSAKEDGEKSLPGFDLGGFGADVGVYNQLNEEWSVGFMLGGQKQDADLHNKKGHVDISTMRAGPFASWHGGPMHVDMAVTYAHNDVCAKQNYSYATGKSDYKYQEVNLFLGTGYDISLDDYTSGLMMTPEFNFMYVFSDYDKYREKFAANAYNVKDRQVTPDNRSDWSSRLGVSLNYNGLQFEWPTELFFGVGWQYNHFDEQKIKCDNSGTIKDHYDENEAYYRLGVNSMLNECLSLELGYHGTHSNNMTSHIFNAGVNYRF